MVLRVATELMILALDTLFSVSARGSYFNILIRVHFCSGGHEFPGELGVAGDVIIHLGTIVYTIFYL